jgi:hypothetical protein
MPEADNEIRIKYSLDASNFLAAFEQIRGSTQDFQSDLIEVANQLQITYKEAGEVMVQALEDAQEAKNALLREGDIAGVPKKQLDIQKAELSEYKSEVTKAVSELNKLSADSAKTQQDRSRELNKVRQEQLKATQQVEKETVKASLAVQREYAKVTQQGYGVVSAGAKEYGKVIQRTRKILEDTTKRSGKSLEEVASRMQRLGVPANQINQALKEMRNDAKQAVQVLQALQKINLGATATQFRQTRDATVAFLNAMRGAHQATQPFTQRIRNFTSGLSELGQVGRFIFGTVFGIGAVQAIRQVMEVFKEAINASLEFQQSLFTLEVAIRGLQRIGLDTTIANWDRRLEDLKKQFPIFSRKEFVDAASLAALMTREFGFTEAQIADLVRQSAILSEITGKDLNEAVRGITFAIGSGYFESLQRAGINISRQVVANEALAQGYKGVYNELEPVIRAQVTYSVIQNNLNAIQEDAGKIVETTTGQVKNLRARWEDFLITLGLTVTESENAKESIEGLALSLELLTEAIELANSASDKDDIPLLLRALMLNLAPTSEEVEAFNEQMGILVDRLRELQGARDPILDDFLQRPGRVPRAITPAREREEERIAALAKDVVLELAEEIEKIEEESDERRINAIIEYQNDVEDLKESHKQRLLDIEQKYQDRLSDINLRAEQRTADEIANNEFRVAEAIRKARFSREDAERKFRERELSAERKFQEKLRQLRENFLLDLEDAVRERDARQIIRLTRQYNLRRDQMIREEKLNKTDRQAQFQEDLRQIEQQKQERLRQLAIEHQRRLDAIALQAERERNQAKIDWERQQEEEEKRDFDAQQKRSDRLNEQLNEIRENSQERINEILLGIAEERELTERELTAIGNLWDALYGPGGTVDVDVGYAIARMAQLEEMIMRLNALKLSTSDIVPPQSFGRNIDNAGGQAEGGTIIARKPTVALFGEAGPEMATFTPLSKLGTQGTTAKITPMGDSMPRDGRIQLEMLLSPDLEARVVDNTLGELADINFAIEKARK